MTSLIERRLSEFVDRDEEMRRFRSMLAQHEKYIMIVWGDSGLGKSSLLARMTHECRVQGLAKAEVVWTDTRAYDYMAVMRKVREDLDPGAFAPFTDLINYFTTPRYQLQLRIEASGNIRVAESAEIKGSSISTLAGISIRDCMFNLPRPDMAIPEMERMSRLTERFLADLRGFLSRKRTVLFLDAIEKMSPDTKAWLWGEFLAPMRDAQLANLTVVLCGQQQPELHRDWRLCVEVAQIRPLELGHIVEYLAKRGVADEHQLVLATMLLARTNGKVAEIAKDVDAFVELQKRMSGSQ